jgi:UDP-2,3-diacylglucosamine pyrophosphatase LpxH
MITHDDVLTTLCGQLNGSVTLVSRVVEPGLRVPSSTAVLLLPDLHLITDAAADKYAGYHFRPNELGALLGAVIRAANELGSDLTRIQLGDRYDLWREQIVDGARTVGAVVSDIRNACQEFAASMTTAQGWQFLAGNHDHELARPTDGSTPEAFEDAEHLIWLGASAVSGRDTPILVLHGDTFDIVEQVFPASLKKGILHTVGASATETTKKLSRDPTTVKQQRSGPVIDPKQFRSIPLPDYVAPTRPLPAVASDAQVLQAAPDPTFNVYFFPSPNFYVLDPGGQDLDFFKAARSRTKDIAVQFARPAPKLTIIGHTHNPRIVASRREDEQTPFLLMDCGAWVEKSTFPSKLGGQMTVYSAHLGVVVGCDIRIYQLPTPDISD